jgi:hypothetical protein
MRQHRSGIAQRQVPPPISEETLITIFARIMQGVPASKAVDGAIYQVIQNGSFIQRFYSSFPCLSTCGRLGLLLGSR